MGDVWTFSHDYDRYNTHVLSHCFLVSIDSVKIMCNVIEVARSDEPKENFNLNLQLSSALWSFKASFSSLFSCLIHNFNVLVTVPLHNVVLGHNRQLL